MGLKGKNERKHMTEHMPEAPGAALLPERQMQDVLSKARIITYIWIILFPPYGLYRVWGGESTFRRSEKWVWTLIAAVYLIVFFGLIITG